MSAVRLKKKAVPVRSARDAVTVIVTSDPSVTGFGAAESEIQTKSLMVTVTELGAPAVTPEGSVPRATVNVSLSVSSSRAVVIVAVPVVDPLGILMLDSAP